MVNTKGKYLFHVLHVINKYLHVGSYEIDTFSLICFLKQYNTEERFSEGKETSKQTSLESLMGRGSVSPAKRLRERETDSS